MANTTAVWSRAPPVRIVEVSQSGVLRYDGVIVISGAAAETVVTDGEGHLKGGEAVISKDYCCSIRDRT